MLVGVWLGLLWVLFYFFDHYIKRVEVIDFRLYSKFKERGPSMGGAVMGVGFLELSLVVFVSLFTIYM